jgi:hypothetical protein
VLSTVAAPRVPYAWVAQTRPGGLVVTPWGSAYKHAGLLSFTVHADGSAIGGLVNTTISFMELRDQRIPWPEITDVVRDTDTPEVTDTDLHASEVCNDDAPVAIALQVPNCHREYVPATNDDGRWCVWFLDAATRSWARFDYQPGTRRWPVHQFGPRRLWNEITTAYQHWEQLGRPSATSWRFTITRAGQTVVAT